MRLPRIQDGTAGRLPTKDQRTVWLVHRIGAGSVPAATQLLIVLVDTE